MTVAENASLRLSCFTFQTHFYLQYKHVTSKKGQEENKEPWSDWYEWIFLERAQTGSDFDRSWKESVQFLLFCYSKEENQVHIIN